MAGGGPVAERQFLAGKKLKPQVGFQVADAGHFLTAYGREASARQATSYLMQGCETTGYISEPDPKLS